MKILLLPFKIVWALIGLMGRMLAATMGIALMILGIILTVTVVGAAVGIPILLLGLLMLLRSFF